MQADFYLLAGSNTKDRNLVLCRLIVKAYSHHHQIYINAEDCQEAAFIDELLWIFRDISFIPHCLAGANNANKAPICIGYQDTPVGFNDILVNLNQQTPSFYSQFKRIIEIVPEDQRWKQCARAHYRFYKEQGLALFTHQIERS